jgi:hypothetical protein
MGTPCFYRNGYATARAVDQNTPYFRRVKYTLASRRPNCERGGIADGPITFPEENVPQVRVQPPGLSHGLAVQIAKIFMQPQLTIPNAVDYDVELVRIAEQRRYGAKAFETTVVKFFENKRYGRSALLRPRISYLHAGMGSE